MELSKSFELNLLKNRILLYFRRRCVITDYEFIHRMTRNLFGGIPDKAINHGFSQRRPIRSVQIPLSLEKVPQISQIYTDFSWDVFLVTQISQMTQIFFIIGRHGISRRRPVRSLQISPWDWTKRFIRDSIKNLWKSVKSVGQKNNEKGEPRQLFLLGSQTNIEITQLSWRYA